MTSSGFQETSSLDSECDMVVDMGVNPCSTDIVVKLVMKSPEHYFFIMKRTDGTCYKTVYMKNQEPKSYNLHKMYI